MNAENLVKSALGLDWEDCEMQARRVAEYAARQQAGSVALPDNLVSHRGAWLDAMDRLIEMEPYSSDPESCHYGQREYWEHERKAMLDMYADLDSMLAAAPQAALPAPDVSGLVEALESIVNEAREMGIPWAVWTAERALAAHKQEGK